MPQRRKRRDRLSRPGRGRVDLQPHVEAAYRLGGAAAAREAADVGLQDGQWVACPCHTAPEVTAEHQRWTLCKACRGSKQLRKPATSVTFEAVPAHGKKFDFIVIDEMSDKVAAISRSLQQLILPKRLT